VLRTLNYDHEERADILLAVVQRLRIVAGGGPEQEQLSNLESWARESRPEDHRAFAIRGFALAGFQYLRMLFGANTAKPDKYIREFVARAIGRPVSPLKALHLLEAAAGQGRMHLRDLDTTIWEGAARNGGCTDACLAD
jgi:hypothetical protein